MGMRMKISLNHHPSPAYPLEKSPPPSFRAFVAVELFAQPVDPIAKLSRGHSAGMVIDVEEGAQVPAGGLEDPAFTEETIVEGCPGEGGEEGDLHIVQPHFHGEVVDLLEDVGCVLI